MGRLRISAAFMQASRSSHCSICSWCPANRVRLRGVERLLYLLKLLADHPDLADDGAAVFLRVMTLLRHQLQTPLDRPAAMAPASWRPDVRLVDAGAVDQHLTAYDLDCNRLTVQCLGARELDNIGGFHISDHNMISKKAISFCLFSGFSSDFTLPSGSFAKA
jgi:hypothetical protein